MQYTAVALTKGRLAVLALALLASVSFGSVAAASSGVGLTECDQPSCALGYPSGNAKFQIVSVTLWIGDGNFVSDGPLDVEFTP